MVKALAVRGATYVICGLAEVVQTVMELESISKKTTSHTVLLKTLDYFLLEILPFTLC